MVIGQISVQYRQNAIYRPIIGAMKILVSVADMLVQIYRHRPWWTSVLPWSKLSFRFSPRVIFPPHVLPLPLLVEDKTEQLGLDMPLFLLSFFCLLFCLVFCLFVVLSVCCFVCCLQPYQLDYSLNHCLVLLGWANVDLFNLWSTIARFGQNLQYHL